MRNRGARFPAGARRSAHSEGRPPDRTPAAVNQTPPQPSFLDLNALNPHPVSRIPDPE
jgi:hypothetical protein